MEVLLVTKNQNIKRVANKKVKSLKGKLLHTDNIEGVNTLIEVANIDVILVAEPFGENHTSQIKHPNVKMVTELNLIEVLTHIGEHSFVQPQLELKDDGLQPAEDNPTDNIVMEPVLEKPEPKPSPIPDIKVLLITRSKATALKFAQQVKHLTIRTTVFSAKIAIKEGSYAAIVWDIPDDPLHVKIPLYIFHKDIESVSDLTKYLPEENFNVSNKQPTTKLQRGFIKNQVIAGKEAIQNLTKIKESEVILGTNHVDVQINDQKATRKKLKEIKKNKDTGKNIELQHSVRIASNGIPHFLFISPWQDKAGVSEVVFSLNNILGWSMVDGNCKNPILSKMLGINERDRWQYDWRSFGSKSLMENQGKTLLLLDPNLQTPCEEATLNEIVPILNPPVLWDCGSNPDSVVFQKLLPGSLVAIVVDATQSMEGLPILLEIIGDNHWETIINKAEKNIDDVMLRLTGKIPLVQYPPVVGKADYQKWLTHEKKLIDFLKSKKG